MQDVLCLGGEILCRIRQGLVVMRLELDLPKNLHCLLERHVLLSGFQDSSLDLVPNFFESLQA